MINLEKLALQLRELINSSRYLRNDIYQRKDGSWDRLWAALDALEDAQFAINNFRKHILVSYLELYGLLQAFVVQQDSIDLIRQTVIDAKSINWSKEQPSLNNIRRLRNETVGHPGNIKSGAETLYCNIDRSSISKNRFRYILWTKTGPKSVDVDISDVINSQEKSLCKIIDDVIDELKNNEKMFMKKFEKESVKEIYSQVRIRPRGRTKSKPRNSRSSKLKVW